MELLGPSLKFGEERVGPLRVERLGEIVAVLGNLGPFAGHLGSDLEVELDPEAALAGLKRLGGHRGSSQSDGAVRNRNGALTTTKLNWWNKVTYKGTSYQAGNLTGDLGSYNEGEFKGGPHPCGKPKKDKKHKNDHYRHMNTLTGPI